MKNKIIIGMLLVITVFLAVTVLWNDQLYASDNDKAIRLDDEERSWIKENSKVKIYIGRELSYLFKDEGQDVIDGVLPDYISSIMAGSKITMEYTSQGRGTLAEIRIVDDDLRDRENLIFSKPVMKISNSLFVSPEKSIDKKKVLTGVAVRGQISEREKEKLTYNGAKVKITEAENTREMIKKAEDLKADCIVGNHMEVLRELQKQKLISDYEDRNITVFSRNVCFVFPTTQRVLASIINVYLNGKDLNRVAAVAESKYPNNQGLLTLEKPYKDSKRLLIIIFSSIFIVFFIYYLFNKNLYNELTDRMDQLTESKNETKTTFNAVSYYMAEIQKDGSIIDLNRAFLASINGGVMEGRHITEAIALDRKVIDDTIGKTIKSKKGQHIQLMTGDKYLDIDIFPIKGKKREVEKLLFIANDVTGLKMAERQMIQDNKMIAVGQLAAGVAHEIRNPLGLIRNYCYVLKTMDAENEEQKDQAIKIIEKAVDTSGKIITNLLNFSRVSSVELQEIYIKNHIDSVVMINEGKLKKKHIDIIIEAKIDFLVKINVESFDMILMNLLSNAIDAIEGNGTITIKVTKADKYFCLSVSDTGSGIDESILEDIFNPFFTTKSNTEGNGLGLYIVYNEINKMNGKVNVKSCKNQGTTFDITLPIIG